MGSKRVDHWTSGTVCECSEIEGSPQVPLPAANYVGREAGRRTCSECETETDQVGLSHCRNNGLVMVRDEAMP